MFAVSHYKISFWKQILLGIHTYSLLLLLTLAYSYYFDPSPVIITSESLVLWATIISKWTCICKRHSDLLFHYDIHNTFVSCDVLTWLVRDSADSIVCPTYLPRGHSISYPMYHLERIGETRVTRDWAIPHESWAAKCSPITPEFRRSN